MAEQGFLRALISEDLLSRPSAKRVEMASQQAGASLEHTILEFGLIDEDDLYQSLSKFLNVPFLRADEIDITLARSLQLPESFLRSAEVMPATETEDGVTLAISDPRNSDVLSGVAFHLNREVQPAIASPSTIKTLLDRLSPAHPEKEASVASDIDVERLRSLANDGPVVKLVSDLISTAVLRGASDIHIEAEDGSARVRFRIDGSLMVEQSMSDTSSAAVVSRLKIMANLNISEKRRPQDGRAQLSVRGKSIDIRISTLPTQFGESVVLRLLDRSRVKLEWNALGFPQETIETIEDTINAPNGIFLIAGPTGSGKTTTLYTALNRINTVDRKIVTVEDPIEYSLEGVNQVQVEPGIDMTFARALRAILRQDPDVVMIGEIRDEETAEIAVRAALVGRMVLSTIHTNDSLAAVTRLLDLGVPRYLLAATLRGVLSQRLVRRLCLHCKGNGCGHCGETGRSGRIVMSEILPVDKDVSEAIGRATGDVELARAADAAGFVSLEQSGAALVDKGTVTEGDLLRVLGGKWE